MKPIDLFVIYSFAILYANGKRKRHGKSLGKHFVGHSSECKTYWMNRFTNFAIHAEFKLTFIVLKEDLG